MAHAVVPVHLLDRGREGEWAPLLGAGLFVAPMTGGYYYDVTFVRLGLLDPGTRLVGLSRIATSVGMAGLALGAVGVAFSMAVDLVPSPTAGRSPPPSRARRSRSRRRPRWSETSGRPAPC